MTIKDIIKIKGDVSDLIRLGSVNDGGYVVNKSALQISNILYTYGVGDNYDFEKNYVDSFQNKSVKMFDPTIGNIETNNPNITFFLDGLYGNCPDNTSFQEHILNYGDENKNIFLKIDTEGAEYNFFNFIQIEKMKNVVGMVVEFHELQNENLRKQFKQILIKLQDLYDITHIHGNNYTPLLEFNGDYRFPSTPEISFLRKDLNISKDFEKRQYPLIDLDYPNSPAKPDYSFIL